MMMEEAEQMIGMDGADGAFAPALVVVDAILPVLPPATPTRAIAICRALSPGQSVPDSWAGS
jgi:hypothetical protein